MFIFFNQLPARCPRRTVRVPSSEASRCTATGTHFKDTQCSHVGHAINPYTSNVGTHAEKSSQQHSLISLLFEYPLVMHRRTTSASTAHDEHHMFSTCLLRRIHHWPLQGGTGRIHGFDMKLCRCPSPRSLSRGVIRWCISINLNIKRSTFLFERPNLDNQMLIFTHLR